MVKMIYDSAITGHHTEYIRHLINYIVDSESDRKYYFVVPEELQVKFPDIISASKGCNAIIWEFIPESIIKKLYSLSPLNRSFAELDLVKQYAKKNAVNEVYLLYFNIFQIALIFKRTSFKIKGILFLQFYRMSKDGIVNKLKYFRKYLTTKLYCLNSRLETVFVLNDQKTVGYLNNTFKTNIFKMLPDPIPLLNPLEGFDIYEEYNIDKNRKVFLHIGSLGDRKGTFQIVDSAKYISFEKQAEIFILLVGKAENSSAAEIISNKIKDNVENSKVQIVWDNQFVSNEKMKSLFDQSYSILMPYKNTEGSSGILGHAAAANKKVISTGKGLLKEIIEEYQLGVLLENVTPNEIALTMEKVFLCHDENIKLNKFVLEHSPNKFSELIISN